MDPAAPHPGTAPPEAVARRDRLPEAVAAAGSRHRRAPARARLANRVWPAAEVAIRGQTRPPSRGGTHRVFGVSGPSVSARSVRRQSRAGPARRSGRTRTSARGPDGPGRSPPQQPRPPPHQHRPTSQYPSTSRLPNQLPNQLPHPPGHPPDPLPAHPDLGPVRPVQPVGPARAARPPQARSAAAPRAQADSVAPPAATPVATAAQARDQAAAPPPACPPPPVRRPPGRYPSGCHPLRVVIPRIVPGRAARDLRPRGRFLRGRGRIPTSRTRAVLRTVAPLWSLVSRSRALSVDGRALGGPGRHDDRDVDVDVAIAVGVDPDHDSATHRLGGACSPTVRSRRDDPYKGAPISLAIIPAVAGPFDLGVVVDRIALQVNPETAQVSAAADPLPTILSGIPLDVRDLRVNLDRPNFTLAPTSCEPKAVQATVSVPPAPLPRSPIASRSAAAPSSVSSRSCR